MLNKSHLFLPGMHKHKRDWQTLNGRTACNLSRGKERVTGKFFKGNPLFHLLFQAGGLLTLDAHGRELHMITPSECPLAFRGMKARCDSLVTP